MKMSRHKSEKYFTLIHSDGFSIKNARLHNLILEWKCHLCVIQFILTSQARNYRGSLLKKLANKFDIDLTDGWWSAGACVWKVMENIFCNKKIWSDLQLIVLFTRHYRNKLTTACQKVQWEEKSSENGHP